jgi:hypothetical protein
MSPPHLKAPARKFPAAKVTTARQVGLDDAVQRAWDGLASLKVTPPQVHPQSAATLQPGLAGALLRRWVNVHNKIDSALAQLLRIPGDLVEQLHAIGVPADKLGQRERGLYGVVDVLERWARDPAVRFLKYDTKMLAYRRRRDKLLGYLVQHVLTFHEEVKSRVGLSAALAAGVVDEQVRTGTAVLKNGAGVDVHLPAGRLTPPRLGIDVETWDGTRWLSFWDTIWFSEHITDDPTKPWGYHWPQRAEMKKAEADSSQLRDEGRRLREHTLIRWTDALTGEKVGPVSHERLFPTASPESKALIIGRLTEQHGEQVHLLKTGMGVIYDARLDMPWLQAIYDLVKE